MFLLISFFISRRTAVVAYDLVLRNFYHHNKHCDVSFLQLILEAVSTGFCNDFPIKHYSSVFRRLRETKVAIWDRGSICYRSMALLNINILVDFKHVMQLDICVRAHEIFTDKKNQSCWRVANASMVAINFSKSVQLIFKYTLRHVDQWSVTR